MSMVQLLHGFKCGSTRIYLYNLTNMRNIDPQLDKEGELYDQLASQIGQLRWSSLESDLIVKGGSEMATLHNMRNVLLTLQQQFSSQNGPSIILEAEQKTNFNKRLLLLEGQIEGMMKRRINFTAEGSAERCLDYSNLLNEKENQIVELEKKINNFEERLRRASARELQLENHIVLLQERLLFKDQMISAKNDVILNEVASSNAMREAINRLKRNLEMNKSRIGDLDRTIMEGVIIPEIGSFEVKGDLLAKDGAQSRSHTYSSSPDSQKLKTKVVQLFREFERLLQNKPEFAVQDIERILEGFLGELKGTKLYENVQLAIRREKIEQNYKRLKDNFEVAAGIYQQGAEQLRNENPGIKINFERNLFDILQRENVQAFKSEKGAVFINDFSQRTVEVPVQDARTKHLLHLFAVELKRLVQKYPKLSAEMDERISEFFQQELIELIEVDEVDRLVQIVKYRPQVVKVENVYAYSNEKSRKIQFHLRVLIKALLEQVEKMRIKSGIIPQMDEGVMGMIRQQIMGVVNVDDILKVFRVVPKIVQVEKIVQKIVERIVEVPQVIAIERIVEKIVEIEKIVEVQRIVNVPIETPTVYDRIVQKIVPIENSTEKVVEVPTICQKIVERIVERPTVHEVQVFRDKIVQVDRVVEVERVVNHIQKQYEQVQLVRQKIVPVEKIVERIVEVPVIVEKIVERIVEVPKIIEVQKIVQKIVPVVEYRNAREIMNHIEVQHQIVERIVQKPVYIERIIERVVEVPQIVQKIVEVLTERVEIREVEVIREKIVIEEKIREVERVNTQIVETVREVIREVQKIIKIPVIHEVLKIQKEFIEKPVIQRIVETVIKEVILRQPMIIKQPKIVQVEKQITHYIQVPKPYKYIEEKIVEVPVHVERIKAVQVLVEKIIEKMVEVPKVVQVEKIVEKIVVVPRVVEKVVEVPQIIEKIVEKQVIREVIREVERRVQVPMYIDRPFEVEKQKNVFFEVEKVVDRIVEKLVQVPRFEQKIEIRQIFIEKLVEVVREIPKNIEVQKIVTLYVEQLQVVEIQRPIITPIEVPVPIDRIVEKLVIQQQVRERIVQVPQIVEKIVVTKEQQIIVNEIERIVERIVIDQKIKEVERIVPYIQEVIKEVPTIVEKIVQVQSKIQQIVTAQQIVQKVIEKTITLPKIYEVERIKQVMVQVPKFIEIERVVPQLVRVNQYIQNIVEKIIQLPMIIEELKEVQRIVEKVVQVESNVKEIVEVERIQEKIVIMERLKEVVRNVNMIEKVLQVIDRIEQIPVEIKYKEEILVQVPYILEKIVEKIVIMPQIVQVLKYVHEVIESHELGVAVDVEVGAHELRYKSLSKNIKTELDVLLRELRAIASTNTQAKMRVEIIEKFLREFEQYILFPKIVKITEEKIVQKEVMVDKIVQLPTQDERSVRMELTLSLLVEKLIMELKRLKETTKVNLELDEDIKLIFFGELRSQSQLQGGFANQLQSYSAQIMRQFESLGQWSIDHQLMLNSFLQERFLMAELVHNANMEIQKAKETGERRLEGLRRYKKDKNAFESQLQKISQFYTSCPSQLKQELEPIGRIIEEFKGYSYDQNFAQPLQIVGELVINDQRIESLLREKQEEIFRLRDLVVKSGIDIQGGKATPKIFEKVRALENENARLRSHIQALETKISGAQIEEALIPFRQQIKEQQEANLELERGISSLKTSLYNIEAENKVLRELSGDAAKFMGGQSYLSQQEGASLGGSNVQQADRGAGNLTTQFGGNSQYSSSGLYQSGTGTPYAGDRTQYTDRTQGVSQYGVGGGDRTQYSADRGQGGQINIGGQAQYGVDRQREFGLTQSGASNQGSGSGYGSQGIQRMGYGGNESSGLTQSRGQYIPEAQQQQRQQGLGGSNISGGEGYRSFNIPGATITSSNVRPTTTQETFRSPITEQEQKEMQSPSTGVRQFTAGNLGSSNVYRSSDFSRTISPQIGTPSRQYKRDTDRTGGGGDQSGKK